MSADRPTIDFWSDFASTYSYLSAMRIDAAAAAGGITVHWRPFLLGPIFKARGWESSPFNLFPDKGRYMWRDMDRLAEDLYLPPLTQPDPFPANSLLAARAGLAAAEQGFVADYTRGVFNAEFARSLDIADREVIADVIAACGHEPGPILERAVSDEIKARLRAETEAAAATDVFGAPSFVTVDRELFWGNDRLEQALARTLLYR